MGEEIEIKDEEVRSLPITASLRERIIALSNLMVITALRQADRKPSSIGWQAYL